ncbi:unnamed protein product [Peniophora sp. CBMAI 1063]|nr:unnamed protein product [Peniophora sp. CBMAI 1063]
MDWVFCGALSFLRCAEVTVCYDIACQWSKNLHKRIKKMKPDCLVFPGATEFLKHHIGNTITYVVPKFHLYAHKLFCQLRYALGLLFGTGATDGEGCERVWSGANPAASSLREMGAGGMSDTMDDMCSSWNWRKTCGIADLLCERMERALDNGAKQTAIFTELTEAIEAEDPSKVVDARAAIRTWEEDTVKKEGTRCPYSTEKSDLSILEIQRQARQAQGLSSQHPLMDAEDATSLADLIVRGLKIEEDRASFYLKHKTSGGTTKQVGARTNALNAILRTIRTFRKEQELYMPDVYAALTLDERDPDRGAALTVNLYLPSTPPEKDESLTSPAARMMEAEVRWASMADELDNLRDQLRLKGCLNRFKIANITGQRGNTRAREAQDAVYENVQRAANAYRRHHDAYFKLVGPGKGGWEETMRELDDSHCRGLGDRLLEQVENMSEDKIKEFLAGKRGAESSGETQYELPWIWFNRTQESVFQITDELMVEWCKSRARAQHWVQEVRLLDEEMRRVVAFSENMAKIWDARCEPKDRMDFGEKHAYACDQGWADGARAYACKQAWIRRTQASNWRVQLAASRKEAQYFLALHTSEGLTVGSVTVGPVAHTGQTTLIIGEPKQDQTTAANTRSSEINAPQRKQRGSRGHRPGVSMSGTVKRRKGKGEGQDDKST